MPRPSRTSAFGDNSKATYCSLSACYLKTFSQPSELSLRGGGWGFPPATFKGKEKKKELKETPSCLIPRLLVVFTQHLEFLVTTLALNIMVASYCMIYLSGEVI